MKKFLSGMVFLFAVFQSHGFSGKGLADKIPQFSTSSPLDEDFLGMSFPTTGSKWAFSKGALWFQASTTIGLIGFPQIGNRKSYFPVQLSLEYSITPHLAVGPYLGLVRSTFTDTYKGESYKSRLSTWAYGGRLVLHATDIINQHLGAGLDVKEWDIYAGISSGLVSRVWQVDQKFRDAHSTYGLRIYPSAGLFLGARYMLGTHFALMAEAGKGAFGFANFGISARFK